MRTLEQVKNYLSVEGMNEKDIHKVIGFLFAKGGFVLGTTLKYRVTNNSFISFVDWYEEARNEFDELSEMGIEVEKLWRKIYDNYFDLRKHLKAVGFCETTIEMIEEILDKMQKTLNEMEYKESGINQEKEEK